MGAEHVYAFEDKLFRCYAHNLRFRYFDVSPENVQMIPYDFQRAAANFSRLYMFIFMV